MDRLETNEEEIKVEDGVSIQSHEIAAMQESQNTSKRMLDAIVALYRLINQNEISYVIREFIFVLDELRGTKDLLSFIIEYVESIIRKNHNQPVQSLEPVLNQLSINMGRLEINEEELKVEDSASIVSDVHSARRKSYSNFRIIRNSRSALLTIFKQNLTSLPVLRFLWKNVNTAQLQLSRIIEYVEEIYRKNHNQLVQFNEPVLNQLSINLNGSETNEEEIKVEDGVSIVSDISSAMQESQNIFKAISDATDDEYRLVNQYRTSLPVLQFILRNSSLAKLLLSIIIKDIEKIVRVSHHPLAQILEPVLNQLPINMNGSETNEEEIKVEDGVSIQSHEIAGKRKSHSNFRILHNSQSALISIFDQNRTSLPVLRFLWKNLHTAQLQLSRIIEYVETIIPKNHNQQ